MPEWHTIGLHVARNTIELESIFRRDSKVEAERWLMADHHADLRYPDGKMYFIVPWYGDIEDLGVEGWGSRFVSAYVDTELPLEQHPYMIQVLEAWFGEDRVRKRLEKVRYEVPT